MKKGLQLITEIDYNWTSTGGNDMSVAFQVFANMVSELSELGKSDLGARVFQQVVAELELTGEAERHSQLQ